jgi:hypothetical protein
MTTTILVTPTPTPYALPPGMVMNPYLDIDAFLGIPVWAWIMAGLFLLLIFVIGFHAYRRNKMAPVRGYLEAVTSTETDDQQVWHFGMNKALSIYCMRLRARVIEFRDDITYASKWLLTSDDAMGSCGGIPLMMVSPAFMQVKDPVAEIAVCTISKEFNKNNAFNSDGTPNYITDQKGNVVKDENGEPKLKAIATYNDFIMWLPILETTYPGGVDVPAYCFYDPSENQQFVPMSKPADFFGVRRLKRARQLRSSSPPREGFFNKFGRPILAFIVGMGLTMFVYLVVTH